MQISLIRARLWLLMHTVNSLRSLGMGLFFFFFMIQKIQDAFFLWEMFTTMQFWGSELWENHPLLFHRFHTCIASLCNLRCGEFAFRSVGGGLRTRTTCYLCSFFWCPEAFLCKEREKAWLFLFSFQYVQLSCEIDCHTAVLTAIPLIFTSVAVAWFMVMV